MEISALAQAVTGPVYRPGDEGYAEEVAAFNVSRQHTPDVVVAARSAEDVAVAVGWARERDLPVGVQATGHGAVVPISSGLLISTRGLDEVSIDPERRTARVGAGVKWRRVLDAAAEHGLAGLCGSTSDVGVVGYTLGGGLPVFGRKYGFSSDHVRSFDVVTGHGRLHHVETGDGSELDWALRGAKGTSASSPRWRSS
jgi:FAD/FMN-containing dehydrogenase